MRIQTIFTSFTRISKLRTLPLKEDAVSFIYNQSLQKCSGEAADGVGPARRQAGSGHTLPLESYTPPIEP